MKKSLKVLSLVLAVVLMATAFAACGGNKDENNKLIMATNATFPPYEFVEGGKIVGIDAEIAQAIADKLGMELVIEDMDFGAIISAVETGKADMGLAGMTVTEDRLKSVNFSESYATGVQVIIVREDSDIKSIDDLEGKMIGVQQDTTGDIYASMDPAEGGYGKDHVTSYKSGAEAVSALKTGKVDCVIIDNEPAKAFVAANDGLKIIEEEFAVEDYAIAISKDNPELLEKVNKALKELKEDGTLDRIVAKYIKAQ